MRRPTALLFVCLCALSATTARAQNAPPPLSAATAAEALAKPLAVPVATPRTRGSLNLRGKRFYIAEYRVLVDVSGELNAFTQDGLLLGRNLKADEATLAYSSALDVASLQALVDRGWADLQARLAAEGITPALAAEVIAAHGAIYEATEPASTAAAPVLVEAKTGTTLRRYLALAPSGQKLIRQVPGGIDMGNIAARVTFPNNQVEAVGLAMALNLSALDLTGKRVSKLGGPEALSPLLELGPAPGAALLHAHAQRAHVNLTEALVLTPEFARLRAAGADEQRQGALDKLLSFGKALTGGSKPRVDAVLEADGPSLARLVMYSLGAANQAITDTLKAALANAP